MSYHDALNYLAQKTSVIELFDQCGGRIAVCPEWNGRVMTSSCEGLEGESFGCINIQAIDHDTVENFGGEDIWSVSPLFFSFRVESISDDSVFLQRTSVMNDSEGASVEVRLSRKISLLDRIQIADLFGDTVADSLEQEDVSAVAFCTENTVQSQNPATIASRMRGMFHANLNSAILLPTLPNDFSTEKIPMHIDFLGGSPHGRIRQLAHLLLVRADGQKRCQVTVPFFDIPPLIGAVNLRSGILTLWKFDLPYDSENDMIRIYNSSHTYSDAWNDYPSYEMNCFSAAKELRAEESITYYQTVLHLSADNENLDGIVQQIFGIPLEEITHKILR